MERKQRMGACSYATILSYPCNGYHLKKQHLNIAGSVAPNESIRRNFIHITCYMHVHHLEFAILTAIYIDTTCPRLNNLVTSI